METYTVRVTRGEISNDATLSSLSLMDRRRAMAIALMDMDGMTAEFMADIDDVLRRAWTPAWI